LTEVLIGLAVVLGAALLGAAALHARVRLARESEGEKKEEKEKDDITGYVTMMVGVFYALILGLSLVSVWEGHDDASQNSQTEATSLHEVYLLAAELPAAPRHRIQADATAYAHYVVNTEWPLMQRGAALPETGWNLLSNLRSAVTSYEPVTNAQNITASDILTQLSSVDAAREGREGAADDRMPVLLWIGLCIGGALTVLFTFTYSMERQLGHIALIMSLTGLIAFVMVLIFLLNNPFAPGFGAGPGDFAAAFPGA
jgi:hypothetical protein